MPSPAMGVSPNPGASETREPKPNELKGAPAAAAASCVASTLPLLSDPLADSLASALPFDGSFFVADDPADEQDAESPCASEPLLALLADWPRIFWTPVHTKPKCTQLS